MAHTGTEVAYTGDFARSGLEVGTRVNTSEREQGTELVSCLFG